MKLRTQQTVLVLGLFVPFLLFVGLLAAVLMGRESRLVERALRDDTRALVSSLEHEMADDMHALELLASVNDLDPESGAAGLDAFRGDLEGAFHAGLHAWRAIALFDANGDPVIAVAAGPASLPSPRGASYFAQAVAGTPAVAGSAVVAQGGPALPVAVPVVRGGRTLYVLVAFHDAAALGRVLAAHEHEGPWAAVVLDPGGAPLARSPRYAELVGEPGTFVPSGAGEGRLSLGGRAGTLIGYGARSPLAGWTVVQAVPQGAALTSGWPLGAWVGGGGALLLLAGLWLAARVSRGLSRDIGALMGAARALGRGRPLPVLPPSRIDEVQELRRELESASALLLGKQREAEAAEELLRQSEERHRGVVELATNLVLIYSDGRITFANMAAARTLGAASPEGLIGSEIAAFLHAEDRPRIRELTEHMLETASRLPREEFRLIAADGAESVVELQAMPFWYEGTSSILMIGQDISRRRRAEDALRESERRFRDFAEVASDWLWEVGPDLRFTYISEQIETLAGVPPAALIGRSIGELIDPALDPAGTRAPLAALMGRLPLRDQRLVLRLPDGGGVLTLTLSAKPVFDAHGAFRGYRGVASVEAPPATAASRSIALGAGA